MTAIRETCPYGARITVQHPDPAPIAADWRGSHPCDRRNTTEREVVKGGQVEQAYPGRHRSDADLTEPLRLGLHATGPLDTHAVARTWEAR